MQTEHRIDELIVDLSFNTTRLARHEKALLSDWLSEDLLPALDQLFSRYSPGQQVLRFEKLEFDFGNLTNRNYQQTIRQQLLQQFAQLLQTQILAIVPTHPDLPEQINRGDNSNPRLALTQLIHYLASGQLSAHRPFEQPIVKKTALHEQLLDAVIAQQDIADLLRELPQRDLLIKRLLMQFPVSQRLELLRQLAPQQVQNTIALLDLLQLFERNAINAQAHPLDSNLMWQVLLQLGLEYPQANTEFWLSRIFNAFSATAGKVNLLQQLAAIRIPFSAAATPLINLQRQIAQLLSSKNESGSKNEWSSESEAGSKNESSSEPVVAVQFASNPADNFMLSSVMDTRVRGYDEKGISHSFSGSRGAESEILNSASLSSEQQDSDLPNSELQNSELQHSELQSSDLPNSELQSSDLQNSELPNSDLHKSEIQNSELQSSYLQNSELLNSGQENSKQPYLTPANSQQLNSNEIAPEAFNQTLENTAQSHTEHVRQRIAAAFIRADAAELQQLWPQLLANQSPLLLAALKHYLPQAEIRQALMLRLPLLLQTDVIALLAPVLKDVFLQLQIKAGQLIELFQAQITIGLEIKNTDVTSNAVGLTEKSPELLLRQLWEIALGLIFTNQTAEGNADDVGDRDTFVMAMAARYADLHNLDVKIVQQVFDSLINQVQMSQTQTNQALINQTQTIQARTNQTQINQTQTSQTQISQKQIDQHAHSNSVDFPDGSIEMLGSVAASKELQHIKSEAELFFDTATAEKAASVNTHQENVSLEKDSQASNKPDSDINGLSRISDHQLFDLCLRLKSGALAWQSLAHDIPLLQRLISSYIRLGHSATAENCADFVAAIETQAESSSAPAAFYRAVLQSLIADKLIDLEAIALEVESGIHSLSAPSRLKNDASKEIKAIENLPITKDHTLPASAAYGVESSVGGASAISDAIRPLSLEALAEQLAQGTQTPESLYLTGDEFSHLVDIVITNTKSIASDIRSDLINAIHQQALQTNHKTDYYRHVLIKLLHKESLDLIQLCEQVNQQTISLPSLAPANLGQPLEVVARASNNIEVLVPKMPITREIKSIAQTLLTESQSWTRVQELQLDNKQWEILTAELIRQTQFNDQHAAAELIDAIQTQARLTITPAVYYRLVIQALLKQDPIDLEAFAARSIAVIAAQQSLSDSDNLNEIPSDSEIENSFFQNNIYSQQINPDQAMDYPLLTGSDNSLHKPALSLAQLLAAELPLSQEQLLALQQHVNALLQRANPTLISEWRELLTAAQHTQVLIHSMPAHLLHQIVMRLEANRYTWLDALVKVVMEALALLVADINSPAVKHAKWNFVFDYLFAANSMHHKTTETSARALELSIRLCEQLAIATGIDDVQRLVNLTQRRIALLKPPAQQKPSMRLQDIATNPATQSDATTPQWEAGLHINNAGQVLAAAFLPRLFSMLNLMQDGKFIDMGAADRAVHLVQFMVTGQSATPEYDLILNKILCGISTSIPVSAGIEITEQEQTLIEQMLSSMIQHWKVLGSTSISGLRETFFQRQGWLVLEEDCWRLKVKEQTFDLLLDRLPWSISLIKHGWMDKPLRVSWRNHS
jgi:uncharacterized protein YjbI with pentapeptide repeats